MKAFFALEVNHSSSNQEGIAYLYYKRIQYKDVEGLKMEWLIYEPGENEYTMAYYFDYNGNIYFMIDARVSISKDEGFLENHYDKNYTNYWKSGIHS